MILTEAQIEEIAARVRAIIRTGSKDVREVPEVSTLAGVMSLPALRNNGGIMEAVRSPISVLSQPATDAAATANAAADNANTAAASANTASGNADSKASDATAAASLATTAANNANTAKINADNAAFGANSAAESANKAASLAIANTNPLVLPTDLFVDYPGKVTLGNLLASINAVVLPQYVLQNILFQCNGQVMEVDPVTGKITALTAGRAKIHIIPLQRTLLRKIIEIDVAAPSIRLLSGNRMRVSGPSKRMRIA
ncbi:hypothetical protein FACS189438_3070 [Bacteroidia bacterium]|nr:hypothetical protein FACS189438_3070 [Bacteroidia bacterium]